MDYPQEWDLEKREEEFNVSGYILFYFRRISKVTDSKDFMSLTKFIVNRSSLGQKGKR